MKKQKNKVLVSLLWGVALCVGKASALHASEGEHAVERKYITADGRAFDSGQTRTGTASIAGTEGDSSPAPGTLTRPGSQVPTPAM